MKSTKIMRTVLALLALVPAGALAQGPPPDTARRAELIAKYDTNGDGKLSESEIKAARPKGESSDSKRQHVASAEKEAGSPGKAAEPANDGAMQALFEKFDADDNGKLDLDEMAALRKAQSRPSTATSAPSPRASSPGMAGARDRLKESESENGEALQ